MRLENILQEFENANQKLHPGKCQFAKSVSSAVHRLHTNFFIITNLIHKFLVHSHKLHKI